MSEGASKINLGPVFAQIESAKSPSKDGVGFETLAFTRCFSILQTAFPSQPGIGARDWTAILRESIRSCAAKGTITTQSFKADLERRAGEFLRAPVQEYVFVAAASIDSRSAPIDARKFSDCTIEFLSVLPPAFDRSTLKQFFERNSHNPDPEHYTHVLVRTSARSPAEAAERASEHIDYLRGVWNFLINWKTTFRLSLMPSVPPVNQVRLGPVQTLHHSDGSLVNEAPYWYEPETRDLARVIDIAAKWPKLLTEEEAFVMGAVSKCRYGSELRKIVVRYCAALDSHNFELAYLRLWSILEHLTHSVGKNYDVTIRRTLFLFRDPDCEFERQVLEHLRGQRNLSVHHANMSREYEVLVYQLKYFVEHMLLFHLHHGSEYESISDLVQILDLPLDVAMLRSRIDLLQRALSFRSGKED